MDASRLKIPMFRGRLLFLASTIAAATTHPATAGAQSAADSADTRGLPLIEVPAATSAGGTIALFLSGDGGWAGIDKQMARTFADGGVAVVGVNLKSYLGTRRTPDPDAGWFPRGWRGWAYWMAFSPLAAWLPGVRLPPDVHGAAAGREFHPILRTGAWCHRAPPARGTSRMRVSSAICCC